MPIAIDPHTPSQVPSRAGLGFIAVTICLDVVSHSMAFPVLPRLVESLVDGDRPSAARWVGVLIAVWSVAQFFGAPIIGMLSDRFGRRPVILISVFGLSLDMVIMALAPNLAWLFVGRALCGLTAGAQAAAMAYVADITPQSERTKSYGWLNAAAWTGVILGPALGGFLGAIDPRAPFWAAAVIALANGLYGYFVLPESLPKTLRAPMRWVNANPVGAMGLLRSRPGLIVLASNLLLLWFAAYALNSIFVLYTAHRYGWTPWTLGVFCSALAAVNILVQSQLAGRVVTWLGERRTVIIGMGLQTLGFVSVALAPTGLWFWIANLPMALSGIVGPALQAMMTSKVDPDEQGRLQGANGAIGSVSGLFGPIAFTQVFAWAIGLGQDPAWSSLTVYFGALLSLISWGLMVRYAQDVPPAMIVPETSAK